MFWILRRHNFRLLGADATFSTKEGHRRQILQIHQKQAQNETRWNRKHRFPRRVGRAPLEKFQLPGGVDHHHEERSIRGGEEEIRQRTGAVRKHKHRRHQEEDPPKDERQVLAEQGVLPDLGRIDFPTAK